MLECSKWIKAFCLHCLITEQKLASYQPHFMLLLERKDLQSRACYHWILCKLCNSFQGLNIWKVLISDHVKIDDLNLNFPHHISLIKFTFQSLKRSFVQIKRGEVTLVYADKILQPLLNQLCPKRKV